MIYDEKNTARVAGVLYLTIIAAGIFADFAVRSSLIVPGDPTETAARIIASESLFRWGIAADLVMIASDVALAAALFVLLAPVSRGLSLVAAFLRLGQAAILVLNLSSLFVALQLLGGGPALASLGASQRHSLALMFLEAHRTGYSIGLVLFGLSLFVLGYLLLRSRSSPRALAAVLLLAGAGYLGDSFAQFLLPTYDRYEDVFALAVFAPALVAELSLCVWLLVRGRIGEPRDPAGRRALEHLAGRPQLRSA